MTHATRRIPVQKLTKVVESRTHATFRTDKPFDEKPGMNPKTVRLALYIMAVVFLAIIYLATF